VTLLRDVEHHFRDQKGAAGVCRVRIFASPEASGGLPVVILTELATNDGPSVTNTVEQLAAEILSRYLPEQDGLEPPFVLLEHYPDTGCRRDHLGAEHFDVVTFAHWHGRPRFVLARRGMLQRSGEPDWRRIARAEGEQLIGQELGEPACTCQVSGAQP